MTLQPVKARIIVVEDEALVAKDLSLRLNKMGFEVIAVCGSPEKAIKEITAKSPDLILMDINLNSTKDGIDVANEVHLDKDTPIVFCTAYSDPAILQRAKVTEPYGYILKPFDNRELEIAIEIALYKYGIEHELHDTNIKLINTLNSIADGVIACNADGVIFLANPRARILCNLAASPIGANIDTVIRLLDLHTGVQHINFAEILASQETTPLQTEQRLQVGNTESIPVEATITPMLNKLNKPNGLLIVFRDISRRIYIENELKRNALEDPVTLLPDRSLLFERLNLAFQHLKTAGHQSDSEFAIVFIDVDRFRLINEGLNYEFGDEVLRRVAEVIKGCIRDIDMVTRFGGDIFAVVIDKVESIPHLVNFVRGIQETIKKPITLGTHHIKLTVTCGIATYNHNYESYGELLRDADTAMARAKRIGANSLVLFDEEMHNNALRVLEIEESIEQSIQQQQFEMYFQPIVDAESYDIRYFEALVRWNHPEKGLVSPCEFIPIAEDSGLIIPLGDYIFEKVCYQVSQWQTDISLPIKVAVNLSSKQFSQKGLAAKLDKMMQQAKVDPSNIVIEVTESMAMQQIEQTIKTLNALREIGVQVAIDDFGTGYSSLAYLKRLPIQTLKIDRSFVIEVTTNSDDRAIVNAIVAMAKELNFSIVVEGIEEHEQVQLLTKLGCHYFQGYLFERPMPAKDATFLLTQIVKNNSKK